MSNLPSLGAARFPAADTITIGADTLPGQWLLVPGGAPYGWQEQKGWGQTGATLRPIGDPLAKFQFLARFWTAADWVKFQPLRRKYLSKPAYTLLGNATYALSIIHPELNALGISSAVPEENPWFTNNGKGLWIGTVKFIQYRKPRPVLEAPNAAIPAAAAPTPSATDALQQEQVTQQAQIMGSRG